jgi:hypothetical protein
MPDSDTDMSYVSDVLLRRLAEQLAVQGMEISECPHGREIVEIAITNPYDRDRGRVVMGHDGFLTWEHWSAFRIDSEVKANAGIIHMLLTEDIAVRTKPAGTNGPQGPGPCRSGFGAGRAEGRKAE